MTKPSAKVILDSISPYGSRLTTFEVVMHRFVLAEFNTHRAFCLAGDSILEFDLPGGNTRGTRRLYKMRLDTFVDRWHNGASSRPNGGRHKGGSYGGTNPGTNRQSVRQRLASMAIRQLNESTGLIQTSFVTDCRISGQKPVYEVVAAGRSVSGSADHLVYTPDGYVRIGDLAVGQSIVVKRKSKLDADRSRDDHKRVGGRWRSVWQNEQRERLANEYGGCQKCGGTERLAVHHIIPVHVDPSLAFDETNILLLCEGCHRWQHKDQSTYNRGVQRLIGTEAIIESIRYRGVEATYDLEIAGEFPNFLANGVVVHNSRNSASSRAIPVHKQIERVRKDPAIPLSFPAEQKGMQGGAELDPMAREYAEGEWLSARNDAVMAAENLVRLGVHKSVANRLIEPFMWHTAVVTTTGDGLENFFDQRCSSLAQPEMQAVAYAMCAAYRGAVPTRLDFDDWHTPYIQTDEDFDLEARRRISAARCARVSYLTHDGVRDPDKDIELYEKLTSADPPHWSPLEHVARPLRAEEYGHNPGNFWGWKQLRHDTK